MWIFKVLLLISDSSVIRLAGFLAGVLFASYCIDGVPSVGA